MMRSIARANGYFSSMVNRLALMEEVGGVCASRVGLSVTPKSSFARAESAVVSSDEDWMSSPEVDSAP